MRCGGIVWISRQWNNDIRVAYTQNARSPLCVAQAYTSGTIGTGGTSMRPPVWVWVCSATDIRPCGRPWRNRCSGRWYVRSSSTTISGRDYSQRCSLYCPESGSGGSFSAIRVRKLWRRRSSLPACIRAVRTSLQHVGGFMAVQWGPCPRPGIPSIGNRLNPWYPDFGISRSTTSRRSRRRSTAGPQRSSWRSSRAKGVSGRRRRSF